MADISKINAVALANIAKLDAVLAANIAKVNGLVFASAPGFVGLLDTYTGAAAGYSTRRLASATTVLLRVRRETAGDAGDDDEADVAYDTNNELSLDSAISNASAGVTATTLGQFLNVGTVGGTTYTNPDSLTVTASCLVDTWYDQSGNGNNAEQTAFGSQPQIHNGTVNTDLITENGKPILRPLGSDTLSTTGVDFTSANTFVYVGTQTQSTANVLSMDGTPLYITASGSTSACTFGFSPTPVYYHNGTEQTTTPTRGEAYTFLTAGQRLLTSVFGDRAGTDMILGREIAQAMADTQELIVWLTDQETAGNRSAIEGNVNAHYQIGNFGTPTSGLLATYTGAAAAYSVRQLANTAALSMRVREDSGDTETNIGFDANGDLDTAAIAAHCGTANGYVVNWFDQAGSQNDATQSTLASQPQIYNGTAVITRNGKPLIQSTENVTSFTAVTLSQSAPYTMMGVSYNHNDFNRAIAYGNGANMRAIAARNKAQFQSTSGSVITASVNLGDSSVVYTAVANGTNSFVRALGETASAETSAATTDTALTNLQPGASGSGVSSMQELILWAGALSSTDYGALETDMDTFFSVT